MIVITSYSIHYTKLYDVLKAGRKGTFKCRFFDLAVEFELVVPRGGTKSCTAAHVMRSTNATLTGITGALLLIGLLTATGNFATRLAAGSSLTTGSKLIANHIVNQVAPDIVV